MNRLVTDYMPLNRKSKEFEFFSNEIQPWSLKDGDNGIEFSQKKPKLKDRLIDYDSVSAIVSSSNYRLIYDLFMSYDEVSFYEPSVHSFNFPFSERYQPNIRNVSKKFSNFLKRGYISYLMSDELNELGLKRIEQFLAILIAEDFNKNKSIYDGLILNERNMEVVSINKNYKSQTIEIGEKISVIDFINTVAQINNYSFYDTFHELLKFYYIGGCTDPFADDGFIILDDSDDFFYEPYINICNQSLEVDLTEISTKTSKLNVRSSKSANHETKIYLSLQCKDYFIGNVLSESRQLNQIYKITKNLADFMPIKDTLLTIQLLVKLERFILSEDDSIENSDFSLLSENESWINKNTWNEIYLSDDYVFDLEPIICSEIPFICPECKNLKSKITPMSLTCSNNKCKFKFIRGNLKRNGIHRVKLDDIFNGLRNKSLLIEKDHGGFLPVFMNNEDHVYKFWVRNES